MFEIHYYTMYKYNVHSIVATEYYNLQNTAFTTTVQTIYILLTKNTNTRTQM